MYVERRVAITDEATSYNNCLIKDSNNALSISSVIVLKFCRINDSNDALSISTMLKFTATT